MSSQKGNAVKRRPQKHKNSISFNPLRNDSNHRSALIANTEIVQVCEQCQEVIQWKIKYKKYKPLTQAKTCTKCSKKAIKNAYHIVCVPCSQKHSVCGKCGKPKEIIKEAPPDQKIQAKERAELDTRVNFLPVRRRRAFQRYMDQLNGVKPLNAAELETEEDFSQYEMMKEQNKTREMSHLDYMKAANEKLEELMKNCKLRHTFDDDEDFSDEFGNSDDEGGEDDE